VGFEVLDWARQGYGPGVGRGGRAALRRWPGGLAEAGFHQRPPELIM